MKHSNLNLAAYEFHIFPIFHHHWKLVVYSTQEESMTVYDMGRNSNDRVIYRENLEHFAGFHEHRVESMRIEEIPGKGNHHWHSGLHLCKIAQNLVMNTEDLLSCEDIAEFRMEILVVLLRMSQINFIKPS